MQKELDATKRHILKILAMFYDRPLEFLGCYKIYKIIRGAIDKFGSNKNLKAVMKVLSFRFIR